MLVPAREGLPLHTEMQEYELYLGGNIETSHHGLSGGLEACLVNVLDADAAAVSIVLQNQLLQVEERPLVLCVLTKLQ